MTLPASAAASPLASRQSAPWLIGVVGLLALYVPLYWIWFNGNTQSDDFGHAPILVAIVGWLFWRCHEAILAPGNAPTFWGWPLFTGGLLLYIFGRVFSVASIAFLSQIPVVAGSLLLLGGMRAFRAAWFPVLYLIFLMPMPASLVDAMTQPLKSGVSAIVVDALYAVGYPIARSGVMISIGPYQLLVADACSGLNSMFSMAAIGVLFIYFKQRASVVHNAIMLASILPIAFAANVVRVIFLVLITFHISDEAGQGFLHGAAGIVLMAAAIGILFALDALLSAVLNARAPLDNQQRA